MDHVLHLLKIAVPVMWHGMHGVPRKSDREGQLESPLTVPQQSQRCVVVRPAHRPRTTRCHPQAICRLSAWHKTTHFICFCSRGIIILPLSSYLVSSDSNLFVQVPFFTLCSHSTIGYPPQLGHRCVNTVHLIKSWIYLLCILKSTNYIFFIKLHLFLFNKNPQYSAEKAGS